MLEKERTASTWNCSTLTASYQDSRKRFYAGSKLGRLKRLRESGDGKLTLISERNVISMKKEKAYYHHPVLGQASLCHHIHQSQKRLCVVKLHMKVAVQVEREIDKKWGTGPSTG
jgi:hypothetical protein